MNCENLGHSMKVEHLITLSRNTYAFESPIDRIDLFEVSLKKLLKDMPSRKKIYKKLNDLQAYVDRKKIFCSKDIKEFYYSNRHFINSVSDKYDGVLRFIQDNYDLENFNTTDSIRTDEFDFFYNYMIENKNKIDEITSLLLKIDSLGIGYLTFYDKNNDKHITGEFKVSKDFILNSKFNYVDNIEIVPNYYSHEIIYKSDNSHYRITGTPERSDYQPFKERLYAPSISVDSLTFSKDRLPDSLRREDTFDKVVELREKQTQSVAYLKHLVDLEEAHDKVEDSVAKLYGVVDSKPTYFVNGHSYKNFYQDNMKSSILYIQREIRKLEELKEKYEKDIIASQDSLTEDIVDEEYLKLIKRKSNCIDLH